MHKLLLFYRYYSPNSHRVQPFTLMICIIALISLGCTTATINNIMKRKSNPDTITSELLFLYNPVMVYLFNNYITQKDIIPDDPHVQVLPFAAAASAAQSSAANSARGSEQVISPLMTQPPAAPAAPTAAMFSGRMPPMAYTGMSTP